MSNELLTIAQHLNTCVSVALTSLQDYEGKVELLEDYIKTQNHNIGEVLGSPLQAAVGAMREAADGDADPVVTIAQLRNMLDARIKAIENLEQAIVEKDATIERQKHALDASRAAECKCKNMLRYVLKSGDAFVNTFEDFTPGNPTMGRAFDEFRGWQRAGKGLLDGDDTLSRSVATPEKYTDNGAWSDTVNRVEVINTLRNVLTSGDAFMKTFDFAPGNTEMARVFDVWQDWVRKGHELLNRRNEDKQGAVRRAARLGSALARIERLAAAIFRFQRAVDEMPETQTWNPAYGMAGDATSQHVSEAYKDLFATDYEVRAYFKAKLLASVAADQPDSKSVDEMATKLEVALTELQLLSNSVTVFQRAIGELPDSCSWNPKISYATNRPTSLGYTSEVYRDMLRAESTARKFLAQHYRVGSANLDESAG